MTDVLARVRSRLRVVDLVGGAVLVAFGLLLLTGHVDVVSAHVSEWLRDLHLESAVDQLSRSPPGAGRRPAVGAPSAADPRLAPDPRPP